MRLPWNRKYMEIGFHVILTVLLLVGMIALLLRLFVAKNVILQTAGTFLAVFAPVFWAFFFTLLLEPLTAFWQRFYEKRCTLYHRSREAQSSRELLQPHPQPQGRRNADISFHRADSLSDRRFSGKKNRTNESVCPDGADW